MGSLKSVFGVIGALVPVIYCGALLYSFIDNSGSENARAVRGQLAPMDGLSTEEADTPFFAPTFALQPGQVLLLP